MLAQRGITPAGFVVTSRRRSRARGYYHSEATVPQRPKRRPRATQRVRPAEPEQPASTT
jgi:hypothetical protein